MTPDLNNPNTRFAIYYTPPQGPLADFGAAWLGWDSAAGRKVAHPNIDFPITELTATPRKYGLHGTIKPPFHLAPGSTFDDLKKTAQTACANLAKLALPPLKLTNMRGFVALTIDGDQTPLAKHAAHIVETLDRFRAPPTPAELAKRRKANLTPTQETNLSNWGYPYVMHDFRFHITLTGRTKTAHTIFETLTPHLAPLLNKPLVVQDLTLLASDQSGAFHTCCRLPFAHD